VKPKKTLPRKTQRAKLFNKVRPQKEGKLEENIFL
jgi:hypothetical protein